MSMIKKICFVIFITLTFIFMYFIGTMRGQKLLACTIFHYWMPGLEISDVNIKWKDITIKHLYYQKKRTIINIGELHLSMNFGCFFQRKLCINDLFLQDVKIQVYNSELKTWLTKLQTIINTKFIINHYSFILRNLILRNMQIKVNTIKFVFDYLHTGFFFQKNIITVVPTKISGLKATIPSISHIATNKFLLFIAKYNHTIFCSTASVIKMLSILFNKSILLPSKSFKIPFYIIFKGIYGENLYFISNANLFIPNLYLQVNLYSKYIKLILLKINFFQGLLKAFGCVKMSDNWPVKIHINTYLSMYNLKNQKISLIVDGSLNNELYILFNFSGPLIAQLKLKTKFMHIGIPWALCGNLPELLLNDFPQYKICNVNFHLDSKHQNYRIRLEFLLSGKNIPTMDVLLDIKISMDDLISSTLKVSTLQGYIYLYTVINWQKEIIWHGELNLVGINTSKQWLAWPMQLDGKIISNGILYKNGNVQLQVPKFNIHGFIRHKDLIANGKFTINIANISK